MKILSGVAIALLLSTAALAQPGPAGGGPGGPMMTGDMPMMGMMMGHCAMMRRSEGALAFLKAELKIASGQEKAWEAFAAAFRTEAANRPKGPMPGGRGGPMGPGMMGPGMMGPGGGMGPGMMGGAGQPFPKAVETHLQFMERHLTSARKLMETAKPLYDALNVEQKKTADELLTHFVMMRCPM
jgi:hypothetical protein